MQTRHFKQIAAVYLACCTAAAAQTAAPDSAPHWKQRFTLKPVVYDTAAAGQGMSLGLDYDFVGEYSRRPLPRTSVGNEEFTVEDFANTRLSYAAGQVTARGSIAGSKAKSPNKLVDFRGDALYVWDVASFTGQISAVGKFETDQSMDDRQYMYGVAASASKRGLLGQGDIGSVIITFGSVNPTQDAERKRLLGVLENYRRWEGEATYSVGIAHNEWMRSLDLGLRVFKETNPPGAVAAEGLDRHRWGVVRLNLKNDLFLQYSGGSLPFDKSNERAIRAGWSMKLE